MSCSADGCGRRVAGRGMCSSHYRRWRTGNLDTPIRGYQRYGEDPDGTVVPNHASRRPSPRRKSPWTKELALLRSLGLR
jgi:hypothetical protein